MSFNFLGVALDSIIHQYIKRVRKSELGVPMQRFALLHTKNRGKEPSPSPVLARLARIEKGVRKSELGVPMQRFALLHTKNQGKEPSPSRVLTGEGGRLFDIICNKILTFRSLHSHNHCFIM